jgi:protein involved in polysaccharide export with SLBB domain
MTTPSETEHFPEASNAATTLSPGDEVQVLYTYWPELDLEQAVRPDGKISLKMVGEVHAEGKTPDELHDELVVLYADKIKDPDLTVVVSGLGSHRVYVSGEVLRPGLIPINGRLTLLEAIMTAGGFDKRSAKPRDVVVVRQQDGRQYARTFNVKAMLQEEESEVVELQPYDVVFVPRTAIDKLDQVVDQYVNQLIPDNFYANYVWNDQRDQANAQSNSVQFNLPSPF